MTSILWCSYFFQLLLKWCFRSLKRLFLLLRNSSAFFLLFLFLRFILIHLDIPAIYVPFVCFAFYLQSDPCILTRSSHPTCQLYILSSIPRTTNAYFSNFISPLVPYFVSNSSDCPPSRFSCKVWGYRSLRISFHFFDVLSSFFCVFLSECGDSTLFLSPGYR